MPACVCSVAVRPGDVIVGDQDGVVVVPASMAVEVLHGAREREEVEQIIKQELVDNPTSPCARARARAPPCHAPAPPPRVPCTDQYV